MNDKDKFSYSYTALNPEERKEVESIKARYHTDVKSVRLEEIRMLDKKARRAPKIASGITGVVAVLTFGGGMALTLELQKFAAGIAVSVAGIGLGLAAYFIYKFVDKKSKEKYGKRILELSDKISGDD